MTPRTPPDEARDALARAVMEAADRQRIEGRIPVVYQQDADAIRARLAASGWVVVPSGEVERLRAVEAAARAVAERYFNAEDASDDAEVYVALTELRSHWTWYGGFVTGPALGEWRCDWQPDELNPIEDGCPYCADRTCARFDGLNCTHDREERHGYIEARGGPVQSGPPESRVRVSPPEVANPSRAALATEHDRETTP